MGRRSKRTTLNDYENTIQIGKGKTVDTKMTVKESTPEGRLVPKGFEDEKIKVVSILI